MQHVLALFMIVCAEGTIIGSLVLGLVLFFRRNPKLLARINDHFNAHPMHALSIPAPFIFIFFATMIPSAYVAKYIAGLEMNLDRFGRSVTLGGVTGVIATFLIIAITVTTVRIFLRIENKEQREWVNKISFPLMLAVFAASVLLGVMISFWMGYGATVALKVIFG